ncbi:hypothetical protein HOLleu_02964 [Holothuria leucospilota]|uniref:Uncharacterized protein n=1 Tax=Holothuria leucospilota TaxID=206669 RepID=A0A9Q1CRE3_HOLLE|nr:hypothetical protein HOLleu_02964 [Holothuria leucospilota]
MMLCRHEISAQLNQLLNKMMHDEVLLIIRNDRETLKVGENTLNNSNSSRKGDKVRENMRVLAKVLLSARSFNSEIKSAKDMIHPSRFDEVVKATRCVSGFDEKRNIVFKSYCT